MLTKIKKIVIGCIDFLDVVFKTLIPFVNFLSRMIVSVVVLSYLDSKLTGSKDTLKVIGILLNIWVLIPVYWFFRNVYYDYRYNNTVKK